MKPDSLLGKTDKQPISHHKETKKLIDNAIIYQWSKTYFNETQKP